MGLKIVPNVRIIYNTLSYVKQYFTNNYLAQLVNVDSHSDSHTQICIVIGTFRVPTLTTLER